MGHYKYLIQNSIHIITVFITTAIMVVLCLSNFIKAYSMVDDPNDLLSNSYVEFSVVSAAKISSNLDSEIKNLLAFTNYINESSNSFILYKENILTKGKALYFKNAEFKPNLKDGRGFTESDFKNNTNTIMISSEIQGDVIEKDGKKYYTVENDLYEVIGIYQKSKNKINIDSNYYYNMLASNNLDQNSNILNGLYQLDGFDNTSEQLINITKLLPIEIHGNQTVNSFSERLEKALSTQAINVFPILLIIVMVLLNTTGITINWIEKRKKEIAIRRLCGSTKFQIKKMLIKEYLLLTTGCFVVGLSIAYIISKVSLWIFIGFDFSLITIIIAFIFTLLIGLSSSLILMTFYDKNEVNGLMR